MVAQSKLFTITYFAGDDKPEWDDIDWTGREEHIGYIAYGKETCPDTEREHYQAFTWLKKKKTLSGAIRLLHQWLPGAHIEMAKGTLSQNEAYCSKEGELITWGTPPEQGKRKDLEDLAAKIKDGETTVSEVLDNDPMMIHKYGRTLQKIEDKRLRRTFRDWEMICEWIYGETGSGKSRYAMEGFDPDTHYKYPYDGDWWDGYTGQETVIIDEFRGQIPFSLLLQLMDRYPMSVRQRGKEPFPFLAKKIIITSCKKPEDVYNNVLDNQETIAQLHRRCTVRRMGPPPIAPVFMSTSN